MRCAGSNKPAISAPARAALYCALALTIGAVGVDKGKARDDTGPATAQSNSRSNGLPWDGRLSRGVRLGLNAIVRPLANSAARGNFYGTSELVSLLERAAQLLAARFPGSQLAVGDLSAQNGGKLDGHHSHRSGLDADVAFFMRDQQGRSARFRRFVAFGSEGIAVRAHRTLRFDDARNWALVSAMLRDRQARVQYIFVAQPLRTRLLMQGRRQSESDDFLRAAAAVMVEPKLGEKHDDHFHVRIYCPRDDRPNCQDSAPYWPWYDGQPPDGERSELPIIRWRLPSVATPQQVPAAAPRAI